MKLFYLPVSIVVLVSSVFGQNELAWRTLPASPTSNRHDDVFFVNANLGWVVNGSGRIYRTTDGGTSWEIQIDVPEYVRSVGFADSLRGWAGTLSGANPLYHTTNSGATWSIVSNIPNPKPDGICGIWVVDDSVVYASGEYDGPAIVIKSTDRGATWTSMSLAGLADRLVDCYFTSRDSGFVVGSKGGTSYSNGLPVVLHTTNGGTTWTTRYEGTRAGELCWKISFPTPDIGYISLEDFIISSVFFLKTTDGGVTWQDKLFLASFADEQGIGFVNPTRGWIGGWNNATFQTTDGGETWELTAFGGMNINRFRFLSDTLGFAVGQRVYKYSREGTTSVQSGGDDVPFTTTLLQNYPNPFNPSTIINFRQLTSNLVTLKIFDVLGREVTTLLDQQMESGSHTVEWDGKDAFGIEVAGGIYVYRITAGNAVATRKMVLLR